MNYYVFRLNHASLPSCHRIFELKEVAELISNLWKLEKKHNVGIEICVKSKQTEYLLGGEWLNTLIFLCYEIPCSS